MKKTQTVWLIAVAFIVIGLLIFVGALAVLDFDFNKLSTAKYETNTYEIFEDFDRILIDVNTTDIIFAPSDDENCKIVCFEEEKTKHTATVQDKALIISIDDTRKWYNHIGISLSNTNMTVYLPKDKYLALDIDTDTGDIEIPNDFSFESLNISGNTSDVSLYASVFNIIKIETDTGDIKADSLTAKELTLSSSTGKIDLKSVTAKEIITVETDTGNIALEAVNSKKINAESDTGNINLKNVIATEMFKIENDTGDVKLLACDAESISVTTDTGDVEGTLLTEKVFFTKTSTGNVNVPKTATGGMCEIETDTGDIHIKIE